MKYKQKYGNNPDYYAALGYDAAGIIYKSLITGHTSVDSVSDYIKSLSGFPGITGILSFDQKGNVEKNVILKQVINGSFEKYQ